MRDGNILKMRTVGRNVSFIKIINEIISVFKWYIHIKKNNNNNTVSTGFERERERVYIIYYDEKIIIQRTEGQCQGRSRGYT